MRTIQRITAILLLVMAVLSGCDKKSPRELLVKKWKMVDIQGSDFDNMPDSSKAKILVNTTMEFTADGKYILQGVDPAPSTGTWSLSEDGKKLSITPDDKMKQPETDDVNELTKDKFAVTDKTGVKVVCVPYK